MYVYDVCSCEFMGWIACCSSPDPFIEIQTHYERFRVMLVTGDLKVDPWDDSEVRTGSYSEYQMVIQFQNRVISCECFISYIIFLFTVVIGYLCFYLYYFM